MFSINTSIHKAATETAEIYEGMQESAIKPLIIREAENQRNSNGSQILKRGKEKLIPYMNKRIKDLHVVPENSKYKTETHDDEKFPESPPD
ncbi:hypothetical protein HUJ05_008198 [Dendroctonus ponderosae]|nr:hypothetical protein HUJ05_008198 [Dendroctonus ponderosae]